MSITAVLVLFSIVWFLILFLTLQIKIKTQGDSGSVLKGTHASSPVNFVKDIKGAVLVLHGSNDRTVEPRHAEDLIAQLKKYDIEYMDMFQAKAGHCIDTCGERASLEYMGIQEEFLDKYLKN